MEFPKTLVRDVVYAVTSPASWDAKDWLILGAGVAGVAAVSLADGQVRTQVQHIQNASALNGLARYASSGGRTLTASWAFSSPPAKPSTMPRRRRFLLTAPWPRSSQAAYRWD